MANFSVDSVLYDKTPNKFISYQPFPCSSSHCTLNDLNGPVGGCSVEIYDWVGGG